MNHNIGHCDGEGCDMRSLCLRYSAHKEAVAKGMAIVPYVEPIHVGRLCEMFLIDHEEKKVF